MTLDQWLVAGLLLLLLAGFLWGRFRYDLVAFAGLVAAVVLGLVPAEAAFDGFGHPAVITVALVLILSRGLSDSGTIVHLARLAMPKSDSPILMIAAMCVLTAVLSSFMNNVGALALIMPLVIQACGRLQIGPAIALMPVSFASILGGMTTLIGTPPNIVISGYRSSAMGEAFGLFDFAPVGVPIAVLGVAFVAFIGWRLLPADRRGAKPHEELFNIEPYTTEARVVEGTKADGLWVRELDRVGDDLEVMALMRGGRTIRSPGSWERLAAGDVLLLRADPGDLDKVVSTLGIELTGTGDEEKEAGEEPATLVEAVVRPGALIENRTARQLLLRDRYGIGLIGISRRGRPRYQRLGRLRLVAGDILLIQGESERVAEAMSPLGLVPLAERGLKLGSPGKAWLAGGLFALALLLTATGLLNVGVAFGLAVVSYVLFGITPLSRLYQAVEWPVIVLLGAMIPVGGAVGDTGLAKLLAETLTAGLAGFGAPPVAAAVALTLVMVLSMTLSDLMNNAATAVVMAPVAVGLAAAFDASSDAFLMAVAIGASSAFLTPIGHQNNTLILGPGGYRFSDYWRMGLPLEILMVIIAIPLLLFFWPLFPTS